MRTIVHCANCRQLYLWDLRTRLPADFVHVPRGSTYSEAPRCPVCDSVHPLSISSSDHALKTHQAVASLVTTPDERKNLIDVLKKLVESGDADLDQVTKGDPKFRALRSLMPNNLDEKLSYTSLIVSLAALANDVRASASDGAITAEQLERLLKDSPRDAAPVTRPVPDPAIDPDGGHAGGAVNPPSAELPIPGHHLDLPELTDRVARAMPDDPNQLPILARMILGVPLAIVAFIWTVIQGVTRALKAIFSISEGP